MSHIAAPDSESSSTATITALSISPMPSGQLLGLADVEIVLDGVPVVVCRVQIRGTSQHSEIRLLTYRAPTREWRTAIILPEEIKAAMGEMVQEAAIEAGLLRHRDAG